MEEGHDPSGLKKKKLESTKLVVLAAEESVRRAPGSRPPLSRAVPFYSIIMQMPE